MDKNNTMIGIKVLIVKYTSNDQPGFVECKFLDALGKEHIIHEKVPVVSLEDLDYKSKYPRSGIIACKLISTRHDQNEKTIYTVDTIEPWGIETIDGISRFEIQFDLLTEF